MSAQLSEATLLVVPLAPLVGAIAAGLFGKQIGRKGAHWITCIGVAIALAISIQTLLAVLDGARFNQTVYEWMKDHADEARSFTLSLLMSSNDLQVSQGLLPLCAAGSGSVANAPSKTCDSR